MGFAEFSKILQKAEVGELKTPEVKKVKEKVKENITKSDTVVARPPKVLQAKIKRKTRASEISDEDIVEPQEPQIEIEVPTIEEPVSTEFDNVVSLFNYDDYSINKFTAIDATYSCIRFEQLKSELQDTTLLSHHKFDIFNYRIYYTREYIYLANVILSKYKKELIDQGYEDVVLTTSLNIPVLILNNDTLVMCKDYEDNLSIEHILKTMLLEKFPNLTNYQIITLNNYVENTISDVDNFDKEILDEVLSNLITILNSNKTYEYLDSDMCENCIFKSTCIKHPQPLGFTLINH